MRNQSYYKYILSFGHMCCDINQGMLAAVLPFLIATYHFNYTTAAGLVMVSNIIGSVIQPFFGQLADKHNKPYIMVLGVAFACGGMALTGVLSNFYGLCVAVMICGIGTAMFHPQAAQMVNKTATASTKGFSLGVFSFGGNLGFTLGPILATVAITFFGLKGTLVFILPSVAFAMLSLLLKEPENTSTHKNANADQIESKEDKWKDFGILSFLIVSRSIIFSGINTFLVLYFIDNIGQSESVGNGLLSCYYAVTACCALFGGKFTDRLGPTKTLMISCCTLFPALILFCLSGNMLTSALLLLPLGIGISLGYSSMVLLGQQYLPNHMGLASGMTLGLAVSIGGIFTPILGNIADQYGLSMTFRILALIAVIPMVVSVVLHKRSA